MFSATVSSGKDLAALGNMHHAAIDDLIGFAALYLAAFELHRPLFRIHDAGDGFQKRRLSRSVGAKDGHDLALAHFQRDAAQGLDWTVIGLQIVDAQDGLSHAASSFFGLWPAFWISDMPR